MCLVASFRPDDLSAPYWRGVPGLRTDTSGIVAFFVVAAGFATSEYLRLLRRRDAAATPGPGPATAAAELLARAISETVALLATALVVYLSVNAVTHPATLGIHATHLAAMAHRRDVAGGGAAVVHLLGGGPPLSGGRAHHAACCRGTVPCP